MFHAISLIFSSPTPELWWLVKRKCGADFVYLIEGCGKTMSEINVPNTPHPDRYEKTEDRISSYP